MKALSLENGTHTFTPHVALHRCPATKQWCNCEHECPLLASDTLEEEQGQ